MLVYGFYVEAKLDLYLNVNGGGVSDECVHGEFI